ncbi:cAMP-binding protein [Brachyspira hampsonii]|uniref:cAMP-binding protein n=2 Tax=Brachyspira hampsonii TaxID=1287055 RepID=A0AAC9XL73_9SPIR|nr:cyclic nucleotide-binding domain-containing protein [Brachyspira hampsonii]ASJ22557.1 cAMP-binding protein [Brachyspira hampsonii]MBW5409903.1 cyclic nucleotide-binding domain-containing protein [Brachyspira hampsonii]OEJ17812.1 cAMP-binding protein [Brachyspira hampsonii]
MINFNIVEFKKDSAIFVAGENAREVFYIIKEGVVVDKNYVIENTNFEFTSGDIIGIVPAVLSEPYYSTAIAATDVQLVEIYAGDIYNIEDTKIIEKIYKYLIKFMEIWLGKYFYTLSESLNIGSYKENDAFEIANIYNNNGYKSAALYMYKKIIEMFPNEDHTEINNKINEIETNYNIKPPLEIGSNLQEYKSGTCIFSELESNTNLYVIRDGKVGVYSVFDGKIITRIIFKSGNIIGYKPIFGNKLLLTTCITLEDTILQSVNKEDFLILASNNTKLQYHLVNIMARRTYNTIIKSYSITIKSPVGKFYSMVYSFVKTELLFDKNIDFLELPYTVRDISSMVGIENTNYIKSEMNKTKVILFSSDEKIIIPNIKNFFKEYDMYRKRNSTPNIS